MDLSEEIEFIPKRTNQPQLDAIDTSFQEVSKDLALILADDEAVKPNQILSKNALQTRYQKELQEEFTAYRKRLQNGAAKLIGSLSELAKENPELISQDVRDAIDNIIALPESLDSDENDCISQSLQEICHITDATLDKLYQGARRLYTLKAYSDAADAFTFLTSLNSKYAAFWLGLANAEYGCGRYKEALYSYAFACEANPFDPNCHIMSCRCYEALGEIENALNALDLALFVVNDNAEYADLVSWITNQKERLSSLVKH